MHRRTLALVLVLGCLLASAAVAGDWPSFRGPRGDGISDEQQAPTQWSAQQHVKWKAPLPQPANGSPIVAGGRVFLTCAQDAEGKLRSLYCFDRADGKQLWVRTVDFGEKMPTHKTNPYCGSTPAVHGDRVVVWHASAGLHCYDLEGNAQWSRDLGRFEHIWGYGTSPVIHDCRVFLHSGPGRRIFLTAIDLQSGQTVWETDEPHAGDHSSRADGKYKGSWCTPIITDVGGQQQLICVMPTRILGYSLADGTILWSCEGIRHERGDLSYSSPVIAGDICVAVGGFRGPGIGVRLGGRGDVTDKLRLWRHPERPQSIGSGVYREGFIYQANAGPSTIQCLDPRTGEAVWTDRGGDTAHWGSVVYAAGHCYVTNQSGTTVVFRPNSEKFELVARNELGETSNSTPAISDGEIFIRTHQNIYCIAD